MSGKISVEELQSTLTEMIDEYGQGIVKGAIPEAVEKTAKETAKQIKSNASANGWKSDYSGGFGYEIEKGRLFTKAIVGNKKKPSLVHLLENGHSIPYLYGHKRAGSGSAKAYPHVSPAVENLESELVKNVEEAINDV